MFVDKQSSAVQREKKKYEEVFHCLWEMFSFMKHFWHESWNFIDLLLWAMKSFCWKLCISFVNFFDFDNLMENFVNNNHKGWLTGWNSMMLNFNNIEKNLWIAGVTWNSNKVFNIELNWYFYFEKFNWKKLEKVPENMRKTGKNFLNFVLN